MKLKYYTLVVDGIDKSGKDTLAKYLIQLSKYNCIVNARGILTQVAYSKLYSRDVDYDLEQQRDIVNIFLTVDEEDWNIRCKITGEPKIDYKTNVESFEYAKDRLKDSIILFEYNTSKMTPYEIAKDVLERVSKLEEERK